MLLLNTNNSITPIQGQKLLRPTFDGEESYSAPAEILEPTPRNRDTPGQRIEISLVGVGPKMLECSWTVLRLDPQRLCVLGRKGPNIT